MPGTRAIDGFLRQDGPGFSRRMRIRVQAGSYETVCRMIAADIGIAVLSESAAKRHARDLNPSKATYPGLAVSDGTKVMQSARGAGDSKSLRA